MTSNPLDFPRARRTTFIVDPDGRVADVLRKVKPAEHDTRVLEALEAARPWVA